MIHTPIKPDLNDLTGVAYAKNADDTDNTDAIVFIDTNHMKTMYPIGGGAFDRDLHIAFRVHNGMTEGDAATSVAARRLAISTQS